MDDNGIRAVKITIQEIFQRRRAMTIMLCMAYAAKALQNFREQQITDEFWNNQTNVAYNSVFGQELVEGDEVGFFLAHTVEYGVYLELANDRKHEALRPVINELLPEFTVNLQRIWA